MNNLEYIALNVIGDTSIVNALLQRDFEAFKAGVESTSPEELNGCHEELGMLSYLEYACEYGLADYVRILLDCNVKTRSRRRGHASTGIHFAARQGYDDIVRMLLDANARVNVEDEFSRTPLHLVAIGRSENDPSLTEKFFSCLSMLLEHPKTRLNKKDDNGSTPLHLAVVNGWQEGAWLLLMHGADPKIRVKGQATLDIIMETMSGILEGTGADQCDISDKDDGEKQEDLETPEEQPEISPASWPVQPPFGAMGFSYIRKPDTFFDGRRIPPNRIPRTIVIPPTPRYDSEDHSTPSTPATSPTSIIPGALPLPDRSLLRRASEYPEGRNRVKYIFKLLYTRQSERLQAHLEEESAKTAGGDLNADNGRFTFLQYACHLGYADCAGVLLKNGADPNATCKENTRPPVLLAADEGCVDVLRLLLRDKSTDLAVTCPENLTLLHVLALRGLEPRDLFESMAGYEPDDKNHEGCLEVIEQDFHKDLHHRIDIDAQDAYGNTALHYAAFCGSSTIVRLLLKMGANLAIKNNNNQPAVTHIPTGAIEEALDSCMYTTGEVDSGIYQLTLQYKLLAPSSQMEKKTRLFVPHGAPHGLMSPTDNRYPHFIPETELLWNISQSHKHNHLLKHPVISSFLYLKWQCIRFFFYMNLLIYLAFILSLTVFLLLTFGKDEGSARPAGNSSIAVQNASATNATKTNSSTTNDPRLSTAGFITTPDMADGAVIVLFIVLVPFVLWLIFRESFQFFTSKQRYFSSIENWIEMAMIILTCLILFTSLDVQVKKHLSIFVILFSWAELVFLVGRHPLLTTYIEMFTTVTRNYLIFLTSFFLFIFAFALCFYLLFHTCPDGDSECDAAPFANPFMSLLQTVLMMMGGFEFGKLPLTPLMGTSHFIFFLFLFLIVIVLVNLLNGLAVSDTQAIRDEAELYSLTSRVEFIYYVESMILGNPINMFNGWCLCCHRFVCRIVASFRRYFLSRRLVRRVLLFPSLRDAEVQLHMASNEVRVEPPRFVLPLDMIKAMRTRLEKMQQEEQRENVTATVHENLAHMRQDLEAHGEIIHSLDGALGEIKQLSVKLPQYDRLQKQIDGLKEGMSRLESKLDQILLSFTKPAEVVSSLKPERKSY